MKQAGPLALWCLAIGCGTPPESEPAPSSELIAPLVGAWRVEGPLQSDCPAELDRSLPRGETRWTDRDGRLHIASTTQSTPAVSLVPVNDRHFTSRSEASVPGCTGLQTLTLVVTQLDGQWASGRYTATFAHDGGPSCERLLAEADLPDGCETQLDWQARRL